MMDSYFLIFLAAVISNKYCECMLSDNNLNIIKSLNEKLNTKYFTILKDFDTQTEPDLLHFTKRMADSKTFVGFTSLSYLIQNWGNFYYQRRKMKYVPRMIIMIYGQNVSEIITKLFTVSTETQRHCNS